MVSRHRPGKEPEVARIGWLRKLCDWYFGPAAGQKLFSSRSQTIFLLEWKKIT
jgi:hypothetical protein